MLIVPPNIKQDYVVLDSICTQLSDEEETPVVIDVNEEIKIESKGQKVQIIENPRRTLEKCKMLGLPACDKHLYNHLDEMDYSCKEMMEQFGRIINKAEQIAHMDKTSERDVTFEIQLVRDKKHCCAALIAKAAKKVEKNENVFHITYSAEQMEDINFTYHSLCKFPESPGDDIGLRNAYLYLLKYDPVFFVANEARGLRKKYYPGTGITFELNEYLLDIAKFSAERYKQKLEDIYNEELDRLNNQVSSEMDILSSGEGRSIKDEMIDLYFSNKKPKKEKTVSAPKPVKESRPDNVIRQHDTNGIFVAEYKTLKEAAESAGISPTSLNKVLSGERTVSGGYLWRRVLAGSEIENIEPCTEKKNNTVSEERTYEAKPIVCYTTEGSIAREYASIGMAAAATGVSRKCITETLKGKQKTAGGFVWKFK